ncbi:hypothetical protein [Nocardia sp. NPDC003345]
MDNPEESVFLVEHVYRDHAVVEVKRIGVYASAEEARSAVTRLRIRPGFSDHPDEFVVRDYVVDRDYWTNGYDDGDQDRRTAE